MDQLAFMQIASKFKIMKVSIIVPIYNIDQYLDQCIQSLVIQTYKNLEIILVNDGSKDGSLEICRFYEKKDRRIKIVNKENGGLVSARKAGIGIASGDYVYYVDGDDWVDNKCIELMVQYVSEYGVEAVIAGHKREFHGSLRAIKNHLLPGYYDKNAMEKFVYPNMISANKFFQHGVNTYSWGKLVAKELAVKLQLGIPDSIVMGEDAAFTYPMLYQARSIYVAESAWYYYRQRANSILKSPNSDDLELERLGIFFRYLKKNLLPTRFEYRLQKQMQEYFIANAIVRTGGALQKKRYLEVSCLFGKIPIGARVCLYSSGSFGQHLYKKILSTGRYICVGWFDEDFEESQFFGLPVSDPKLISDCQFDFMIVATMSSDVFNGVKAKFIQDGISANKIQGIEINPNSIEEQINALGFCSIDFEPLIK